MGEFDVGASAPIELPARPVMRRWPVAGRRRHRLLTGTSGLLLFVCMFLPAVDGCSAPIVPAQVPPLWGPDLYGAVFALVALARTQRGLALGTFALRTLAIIVVAAGGALVLAAAPIGIAILLVGAMLVGTIGWSGVSERRLAGSAFVAGVLATGWFALWCMTPAALHGAYLSLASAAGLMAGATLWLREATHPTVHVPTAVVQSRPLLRGLLLRRKVRQQLRRR